MQRGIWIATLLTAASLSVDAQTLNLRTGGWDLVIKDSSDGETVEIKTKMCLKKEDLDADAPFRRNDDAENCKTTLRTRTATRMSYIIVCTGVEASRSTYDITAGNPETMTIKGRTEGSDSGTIEVTGRFASASCLGYTP